MFETMFTAITTYYTGPLGHVELAGSIFSIICVYFAIKQNIWTWFWGILGCVCFSYLFFAIQLYFDMALQVFFFFVQIWGYNIWRNMEQIPDFEFATLERLQPSDKTKLFLLWGTLTLIGGYLVGLWTNASIPYLDAGLAFASVIAQLLLMKKYVENWIIWIAVDVFSIGMYFYKGVYVTSALYAVFLVLATMGYLLWKKRMSTII